jgi:hypothetical protein
MPGLLQFVLAFEARGMPFFTLQRWGSASPHAIGSKVHGVCPCNMVNTHHMVIAM